MRSGNDANGRWIKLYLGTYYKGGAIYLQRIDTEHFKVMIKFPRITYSLTDKTEDT